MKAKVNYTLKKGKSSGFDSEYALTSFLETLNAKHIKVRGYLFVDMEDSMCIVREATGEVLDFVDNTFGSISDFCACEFDIEELAKEEIIVVDIKKIEFIF